MWRSSSPRPRPAWSGRLSIARDGNPVSHHVAELGLMVAAGAAAAGVGAALMKEAVEVGAGARA